jgi:hypothetical protein
MIQEEDYGQEWEETEEEKMAKILPESPASANIKVYIDGFGAQITVRGTNHKVLVTEIEEMVKMAKIKNWKPSWNPDTNKAAEAVTSTAEDSKWCSVHGESMPKKWSEKKQKTYWAHKIGEKMCFGSGFKE